MSENKDPLISSLDLVDLESHIRRLEVELQTHQQKVRLFEQSIREQQELLAKVRKETTKEKFVQGEYHDRN